MALHPHVEQAKKYYLEIYPDDEKSYTARKLISNKTKKMWSSLLAARTKIGGAPHDNHWVIAFLSVAYHASEKPPYFYQSRQENKELAKRIEQLTSQLSKLLRSHRLDFNLVHIEGKIMKGFHFFEHFGESNRARMNAKGIDKLPISNLLLALSQQAKEDISYAYSDGKAGKKIREIRFIREIAKSNKQVYGSPLNAVIAEATAAIYNTVYSESDIANLLNRKTKKESPHQVVERLASLKEDEYELRRGGVADSFGIHPSTLDDAVISSRAKKTSR